MQACLDYYRIFEINVDDKACVGWFPYTWSSGKPLDISSREAASADINVYDVQLKRFVSAVTVRVKSGTQKTLEEANLSVIAVYCSSSGLSEPTDDIRIVDDEISEEDAPETLAI